MCQFEALSIYEGVNAPHCLSAAQYQQVNFDNRWWIERFPFDETRDLDVILRMNFNLSKDNSWSSFPTRKIHGRGNYILIQSVEVSKHKNENVPMSFDIILSVPSGSSPNPWFDINRRTAWFVRWFPLNEWKSFHHSERNQWRESK